MLYLNTDSDIVFSVDLGIMTAGAYGVWLPLHQPETCVLITGFKEEPMKQGLFSDRIEIGVGLNGGNEMKEKLISLYRHEVKGILTGRQKEIEEAE